MNYEYPDWEDKCLAVLGLVLVALGVVAVTCGVTILAMFTYRYVVGG